MLVLDYQNSNIDVKMRMNECIGFATDYGVCLNTDEKGYYIFFEEGYDQPRLYRYTDEETVGDVARYRGSYIEKIFKNKEDFIVAFSFH